MILSEQLKTNVDIIVLTDRVFHAMDKNDLFSLDITALNQSDVYANPGGEGLPNAFN
jgi:hypothetical protein